MSIDSKTLTTVIDELNQILPARVDKIQQVGRQRLLLNIRGETGREKLMISAEASDSTIYCTAEEWESPLRPPAFLQQARKQIQGAKLLSIVQPESERIAILIFSHYNELGDYEELRLICELMGRHSNIILCRDKLIIDAIKHIDSSQSRHREVLPLREYVKPPARTGLEPTKVEELILSTAGLDDFPAYSPEISIRKFLFKTFTSLSPIILDDVLVRRGLEGELELRQLEDSNNEVLLSVIDELAKILKNKTSGAFVYYKDEDLRQPYLYHCLDLQSLPYRKRFESVLAAQKQFYLELSAEREIKNLKQSYEKILRKAEKKLKRKLELHEADYESARDCETIKKYCELLQANFPRLKDLPAVAKEVAVIDYWDDNLQEVIVPLKAGIRATRQPEYYAKVYKRKEEKLAKSKRLIEKDRQKLAYLEDLKSSFRQIEDPLELADWAVDLEYFAENRRSSDAVELDEKIYPDRVGRKRSKKKVQQARRVKKKQDRALPPRRFYYQGFRIEVGRNNKQNDYLSLHKAGKNNLWYHLKNAPGSHVILYCELEDINPQLDLVAAELAVWFSSARKGKEASGEVDRCTVKGLRKVKGQPPGTVYYNAEASFRVHSKGPENIPDLEID